MLETVHKTFTQFSLLAVGLNFQGDCPSNFSLIAWYFFIKFAPPPRIARPGFQGHLTAFQQSCQLRLQLQSTHRILMLFRVDAGLSDFVQQG